MFSVFLLFKRGVGGKYCRLWDSNSQPSV